MSCRRIHDRALLDALEAITPVPYCGPVWRVCRKERDATLPWTVVGRWSDGSFAVLYTSLESNTCLAEVYFHYCQKQPVPPSKIRFSLNELKIDLTQSLRLLDTSQLDSVGVTDPLFYERSFQKVVHHTYPITQAVGAAANFLGYDGLLVPSARIKGTNVVLLTDNITPEREIQQISSQDVDLKSWGPTNN